MPTRWGRHQVGPLRLRVVAGGGLYVAPLVLEVGEIVVFPAAAALARAVAPRELAAPLGEHASRAVGLGGRVRRACGRTSRATAGATSTGAPRRATASCSSGSTPPSARSTWCSCWTPRPTPGRRASSTLDLTVRAATGLAQSYLRAHDRVGLVTFGGPLRWLTPATGPRQLYRVSDALMSMRPDATERDAGDVGFGLADLPRSMLPGRAFVCVVTPLLDDRPLAAVRLLLDRGFAPLVVDVLTNEPHAAPRRRERARDELALRTWRMHREALVGELAGARRAGPRLGRRGRPDRRPEARHAGRRAAGADVRAAAVAGRGP